MVSWFDSWRNSKWAPQPQAAPVQNTAAAPAHAAAPENEEMAAAAAPNPLKRKRGTKVDQAYDAVKKLEAEPAAGMKIGKPVVQPKQLSAKQQAAADAFHAFVENRLPQIASEAFTDADKDPHLDATLDCVIM